MQSATQTLQVSKKLLWAGGIINALTVVFLVFDSIIHLPKIGPVEAFAQLGYPEGLARPIGIIGPICVTLYVIPRTSILGAVLLTGYLGGAIATQLRVGNPLFSQALFPVYVGVLVWVGLFLRDDWLRALMTLQRQPAKRVKNAEPFWTESFDQFNMCAREAQEE